jgi:hypothetical protein
MSTISAGTTNSTALVETGDTTGNLIIKANTSTTVGTFSSTGLAVVGSLTSTVAAAGAFTTLSASNGAGSRAISVLGGSIASFYDSSAGEQGRIQASTSALFLSTVTTNPININVNSTTVGTFNAYGLGIGSGVPSSGMGITFPATQSASTNANTLDDYEEGTWTPSVGGTATYTIQSGTYVKIGQTVTLCFDISIGTIGTGSTYVISGNPFTSKSGTVVGGNIGYWSASATAYVSLNIRMDGGATNLVIGALTAAATGCSVSSTLFGDTTRFAGTFTYQANA